MNPQSNHDPSFTKEKLLQLAEQATKKAPHIQQKTTVSKMNSSSDSFTCGAVIMIVVFIIVMIIVMNSCNQSNSQQYYNNSSLFFIVPILYQSTSNIKRFFASCTREDQY